MNHTSGETKQFISNIRYILFGYQELDDDDVQNIEDFKGKLIKEFRDDLDAYVSDVLSHIPEDQHDSIDISDIKTEFINNNVREKTELTLVGLAQLHALSILLENNDFDGVDLDIFHHTEPKPSFMVKTHLDYFLKDMRAVIIDPCEVDTKTKFAHMCGDESYIGTWRIINLVMDSLKNPEELTSAIPQNPKFFIPEFFNMTLGAIKSEMSMMSAGLIGTNIGHMPEMREAWSNHIEALSEVAEDINFIFDQWKLLNPENTPATPSNRVLRPC